MFASVARPFLATALAGDVNCFRTSVSEILHTFAYPPWFIKYGYLQALVMEGVTAGATAGVTAGVTEDATEDVTAMWNNSVTGSDVPTNTKIV